MTACLPIYLQTQIISGDDLGRHRSIMFAQSQPLNVRGASGLVTTQILRLHDEGIVLGRVQSTGHEIALSDTGNYTVLLPAAGRLDIQTSGTDYRSFPGRPLVFRPTERRTRATPPVGGTFRATTLQVSAARMKRLAFGLGLDPDRTFAKDAEGLHGPVGRYLVAQLPQLADDIFLRPDCPLPPKVLALIGTLVDDVLCELAGGTAEGGHPRTILPAFHRVRLAEDLMHAESDEPLSMLDLATRLGVSLRSLQLAFNEIHGASPRHVLNRIRLEKARRRFLAANGNDQVTKVALDSGFLHLSRFAQAYARTYGERPSETLARRRA
jgi:AraC-like DNA-binding protein